ncbi:MAG: tetratricopeptide repeat protein [Planctomycetota bacterium]|nr:MAG: tetratricopeptide repeat protein [Planctomycetota bacterium]
MSQSPDDADADTVPESYAAGWAAVSKLIRRGFSWSGHELNCAFLNTGDGTFADVSAAAGFAFGDDGRAACVLDWDLDGDLDLIVANRTGPRVRFLRNDSRTSHGFLALSLVGSVENGGNRDAIGARVEVELAGDPARTLIATRRAGSGYLAQSSAWLHFGLAGRGIARVSVRWPDGAEQTYTGLTPGGRYVLREGREDAEAWSAPASEPALAAEQVAPASTRKARVVLPAFVPLPRLGVETPSGERAVLFGLGPDAKRTGRPLLLNLFAGWCAPCATELAGFAARVDEVQAAGLDILALSVDAPEERDAARALLERVAWPYSRGFASTECVGILDVLQGIVLDNELRIPVPTSLLIDREGRLAVLYLGPVEVATVLADLALLEAEGSELRDAAVPFPGTWLSPPATIDLAVFERRFTARGFPEIAQEFHIAQFEINTLSEAEFQFQIGVARVRQGRLGEAVERFQNAVAIDPDAFDAHRELARTLHELERFEDAIQAYERALQLKPEADDLIGSLGVAYFAADDLEAAERQVQRLRELGSPLADPLELWLGAQR